MDEALAEGLATARDIAATSTDVAARMAITALVSYVENVNRLIPGGLK